MWASLTYAGSAIGDPSDTCCIDDGARPVKDKVNGFSKKWCSYQASSARDGGRCERGERCPWRSSAYARG